ncbi:MAG TPA: DedA family protein [Steroidobacteraceae bacterium]|jgi:membrane protein DedA with SNARE-associated domain|nr:DedA family protein [Steroidobacteraceae bacterium]
MAELLHHFSDWYLATLAAGGYWLIAGLMALESTFVPIPSEVIIPPAAYLAHTQGQLSFTGVVIAGTIGSWAGAALMYWAARLLGYPVIVRFGRYVAITPAKLALAERWCARYGVAGVFLSRLLPVIRHLIGIPTGLLRLDFRHYALSTLLGSLLWCTVLAWLGRTVGEHPELIAGSLHRFFLLVLAVAAVLAALYYAFVRRVARG